MLAAATLRTNPGATILHNLICSRSVPEVIREHGGVPVRTKVGHSFIKQVMADTGAVFGGEHSAHYYFARNYRADSGLIASMLILDEVSRADQELSVVRKPFERYSQSGEINTQVADAAAVLAHVGREMADCAQDHLDGLTVDAGSWWFNLRPSNTEPCCASTSRPRPATSATPASPTCWPMVTRASRWPSTPPCSRSSPARRTRVRSTTWRTRTSSTTPACTGSTRSATTSR